MRSIRTKITLMVIAAILAVAFMVSLLSVIFIRQTERRKSEQLLLLLCETGERNLDFYFNSVQKSVRKVASFVEADLDGLEDEQLSRHMDRVGKYFDEMASKTNGVLTYYYRIDPEVSSSVKGFWYTDLDGEGFVEHEVTDITLYDTSDTSKLVWFTVPKYEGKAVWLPPYVTDNLGMRVISYNMPIYWRGQFVGVVGIEIDYTTMAEQVDSIRLYSNGYAFLNNANGDLFYHPRIDVSALTPETTPETPDGVLSESTFVRYRFEDEEKWAAWLALSNGMRLNVTVPVAETEGDWEKLVLNILLVSAEVLLAVGVVSFFVTKRITRPLDQLTEAANQIDRGNYDYTLDYEKPDEIGRLTKTFHRMASHMKDHITDLNKQAFIDALTHVKNKGAFAAAIADLGAQTDGDGRQIPFAIGVFDCDDLKQVNDQFGHDKGDLYLKNACRVICRVFQHSPVFRIGGDEFAVILRNEDYRNRDELVWQFEKAEKEVNEGAENRWDQVHLAMGLAVYDPDDDPSVMDVVRRADKNMYENKRMRKTGRTFAPQSDDGDAE